MSECILKLLFSEKFLDNDIPSAVHLNTQPTVSMYKCSIFDYVWWNNRC